MRKEDVPENNPVRFRSLGIPRACSRSTFLPVAVGIQVRNGAQRLRPCLVFACRTSLKVSLPCSRALPADPRIPKPGATCQPSPIGNYIDYEWAGGQTRLTGTEYNKRQTLTQSIGVRRSGSGNNLSSESAFNKQKNFGR